MDNYPKIDPKPTSFKFCLKTLCFLSSFSDVSLSFLAKFPTTLGSLVHGQTDSRAYSLRGDFPMGNFDPCLSKAKPTRKPTKNQFKVATNTLGA